MKKGLKLLSLAMLFALPLAACGDNSGSNTSGNQEGGQQQEGGGQEEGGGSGGGGGQQGGGGQEEGGGGSGGGGGGGEVTSSVVLDFSKLSDVSGKVSGVSFKAELGTNPNNTKPAYNESKGELRLYVGNTLTISGATFTSIEFDANGCGETKADGTLSASTGKMSGFTWTGSASSVVFSAATGKQVHINKITISANGAGGGGQEEGGGGSGGGENYPVVASKILDAAKAVYVNFFESQPSSIGDYDDEESEADMYTCKNGSLEFAGFYGFEEIEDESVYAEIYEELVDALPNGAVIYEDYEDAEIDEEYGYYDMWYINDGLIYAIYVTDYYGYYVIYSVDVFEEEEADNYIDYVYTEEVEEEY